MSERPPVFDRALHLARLQRHSGAPQLIEEHVAAELAGRLQLINRSFARCLLVAHRGDLLAGALSASGKVGELVTAASGADGLPAAIEPPFNAIFHMLDLQAVNDVPALLKTLHSALLPDGLLLIACFGGETLTELRSAWLEADERVGGAVSPRVAPMISVRDMGMLLQHAGLALPVVDKDRLTVRYADAFALMLELRAFGFSNPMHERSRKPVSRRHLAAAAEVYSRRSSDADGRIRATVELIWATGWAPHESQQKPLKPGSAKSRLADALKVKEEKL
jgi:SAM-dependent methyltransferase